MSGVMNKTLDMRANGIALTGYNFPIPDGYRIIYQDSDSIFLATDIEPATGVTFNAQHRLSPLLLSDIYKDLSSEVHVDVD